VLVGVPRIHRSEALIGLMDRDARALGQDIEPFVGHDSRNLNDPIGFRGQPRHFQVDPN